MRQQVTYVVGIVVVSIAGLIYTFVAGNEPLLGLDLQGGASVVLEPEPLPPEELSSIIPMLDRGTGKCEALRIIAHA